MPAHPLDGCSIFSLWCLGRFSLDATAKIFIVLGIPFVVILAWWGIAASHFGSILLALWLLAQTLDLAIRVRQGPAGLAKHPMFTIAEQMKLKTHASSRGVDVRNWGSGVAAPPAQAAHVAPPAGGHQAATTPDLHQPQQFRPAAAPVVHGIPTTQQQQNGYVASGQVVQTPYVGGAQKPEQQQLPPTVVPNATAAQLPQQTGRNRDAHEARQGEPQHFRMDDSEDR